MTVAEIKKLWFSFEGRINRQKYWVPGTLLLLAVFTPLLVVVGLLAGSMPEVAAVAGIVLYIPLVWASLALSAKRLHDRNRSAWFMLLFLVPLVGLWPMVEIYFLPGTQGPNRFGEDPLA